MEPNTANTAAAGTGADPVSAVANAVSNGFQFLKEGLKYAFGSEQQRKQAALQDALTPNPWLMPRDQVANYSLLIVVGMLGLFFITVLVLVVRKQNS